MDNKELNLVLQLKDIQLIIGALGTKSFNEVNDLIGRIIVQSNCQLKAEEAVEDPAQNVPD